MALHFGCRININDCFLAILPTGNGNNINNIVYFYVDLYLDYTHYHHFVAKLHLTSLIYAVNSLA